MPKKSLIVFCFICLICAGVLEAETKERRDVTAWKTRIEFSYINTSGNTDTQTLGGKLGLDRAGRLNRLFIKGNILYSENKDEETANRWSLDSRWERTVTERLFGFLSAGYLDDKFSGYDYRITVGPGLGYDLLNTKVHQLKGLVSILYEYERFIEEGKDPDSYASGKTAINYVWHILENLRLKENADYSVSFEDMDKYFINAETTFEIKINTYLSLGMSYLIAYQNLLPSDDIKHTDTTFLTTLIIDY